MTTNSTSTPVETLAAAETRVKVEHERLSHTLAQLQTRLDPRERANRAAHEARVAGRTAANIAREKPEIIAGVAAVTTLFLARRRIAALFRRRRKDTPPADAGLTPVMRIEA